MRSLCCLLLLAASFSMVGCSANVESFHSTATMGQQLADLDASYQSGAITKGEYDKAKKIILDKYK